MAGPATPKFLAASGELAKEVVHEPVVGVPAGFRAQDATAVSAAVSQPG